MDGYKIEFVPEFRYLGELVDQRLNFKPNFEWPTIPKAGDAYFESSTLDILLRHTKITVYKALVKPHRYHVLFHHPKLSKF